MEHQASAVLAISGQLSGSINFAMQQNYIPIFRNLVLTNLTEANMEQVLVRISFEPAFAKPFEVTVPLLAPNTPVELSPVRIVVSPDYLFSLTEKMTGNVTVEAIRDGVCIHQQCLEIQLLAYDEWPGSLTMPELIAAFITPNHPKVAEVTAKASQFLHKWVGSPSFSAYQSKNPNFVKQQAAAIYAAL